MAVVDVTEIEAEAARLDALFAPIANGPYDPAGPDYHTSPLPDLLGVRERTDAVLHALIDRYATGDEPTRARLRAVFDRHPSFRWAAHLPAAWQGPAELRDRLIHLSARDQGADVRDELLTIQGYRAQALAAGIDVTPILDEVAAMSSTVDRYGMGSMRDVIGTVSA